MEFSELVKQRRTVRRFAQRPVPDAELRLLVDSGRMASCGANLQRLRYIVIREPELLQSVFEQTSWGGYVKPFRQPRLGVNAPPAFVAVTAPEDAKGTIEADAGAALQTMEYAAWNAGLGCCWIGAFNREAVGGLLNARVLYLLAVGFPAEHPVAEEIPGDGDVRYYLDPADTLHVPKIRTDDLIDWR